MAKSSKEKIAKDEQRILQRLRKTQIKALMKLQRNVDFPVKKYGE